MKEYLIYIFGFAFAIVFFVALGWMLMPVNKMVERKVLVNSHQYIEGMQQRSNLLKANIAEIDAMLATGQGDRNNLLAQKRALSAQLKAVQ